MEDSPEALLSAVRELEGRLRSEVVKKSDGDVVRQWRQRLQHACAVLLRSHHEEAWRHEMELVMWNKCFHPRRCELKAAHAAALSKETAEAYHGFLQSSISFYAALFRDLQLDGDLDLRGLVDASLIHPAWAPPGVDPSACVAGTPEVARAQRYLRTCTRCLIALGDLTRYCRDVLKSAATELKAAQRLYEDALHLSPDHGNAHNQLAVLATYEEQSFTAVYHYMCSVAVAEPFVTALENLNAMFRNNRRALQRFLPNIECGRNRKRGGGSKKPKPLEKGQEEGAFWVALIRLEDMVFTQDRGDMQSLKQFLLRIFSVLLARNTFKEEDLNRIVVSLIFSVHSMGWSRRFARDAAPDAHVEPFQSVSDTFRNQQAMIGFLLDLTVPIVQRATRLVKEQTGDDTRPCRHLSSVVIVLRWLQLHAGSLSHANVSRNVAEKRRTFWNAVAQLATQCHRAPYNTHELAGLMRERALVPLLPEEVALRGFLCLAPSLAPLPPAARLFEWRDRASDGDIRGLSRLGIPNVWLLPHILRMFVVLELTHELSALPNPEGALYFSERKGRFGVRSSQEPRSSASASEDAAERAQPHSSQPMRIVSRARGGAGGGSRASISPGYSGPASAHQLAAARRANSTSPGSPSRGYLADPAVAAALASSMKEKEVEAANQRLAPVTSSPPSPASADDGAFTPGEGARVRGERRDASAIGSGRMGPQSPLYSPSPVFGSAADGAQAWPAAFAGGDEVRGLGAASDAFSLDSDSTDMDVAAMISEECAWDSGAAAHAECDPAEYAAHRPLFAALSGHYREPEADRASFSSLFSFSAHGNGDAPAANGHSPPYGENGSLFWAGGGGGSVGAFFGAAPDAVSGGEPEPDLTHMGHTGWRDLACGTEFSSGLGYAAHSDHSKREQSRAHNGPPAGSRTGDVDARSLFMT